MKQLLMEQLTSVYDESNWFVCFNVAVHQLTEYEVHTRSDEGQENTIAEIINHLYFYNARYMSRFRGEEVPGLPSHYDTFQPHDNMSWKETIEELQAVFSNFRKVLEEATDEKVAKWAETLSAMWLHNAYHIGQVVHIRKQFGSWSHLPVVRG